jgi:hypothetical protein
MKVEVVVCPVMSMATFIETPAPTRLRTAARRRF